MMDSGGKAMPCTCPGQGGTPHLEVFGGYLQGHVESIDTTLVQQAFTRGIGPDSGRCPVIWAKWP
jgi:hypothetical protein